MRVAHGENDRRASLHCPRNGNDLATVSQLLGHSSVSVTADFYAVFNTHELALRHSRFSAARHLTDSK